MMFWFGLAWFFVAILGITLLVFILVEDWRDRHSLRGRLANPWPFAAIELFVAILGITLGVLFIGG